ncbi:unnamed protein product [Arabis nemorensis]|uniref:WAT1-related protein n=1 Tax=Arabis nemorensis TaxID=586526 RepID=A0A565B716_9BRAS|nr:unnamed protein product [Arabis nemorensis]
MFNLLPTVVALCLQVGLSVMAVIAKFALDSNLITPRVLVAERLVIASAILMTQYLHHLLSNSKGMQLTTPTFTSGMFNLLPAITFVMACIFRLEKLAIHSHRGKAKILGTCVAVGEQ